jgi:hypothetical protein
MADPNMRNFYRRVGRIERMHEQGAGFEAAGTLGMSYYNSLKRSRRRMTWLMPVALVLATIVVMKATILVNIGPEAYAERVAGLEAGTLADRMGAYVLQADPITQWLATALDRLF